MISLPQWGKGDHEVVDEVSASSLINPNLSAKTLTQSSFKPLLHFPVLVVHRR